MAFAMTLLKRIKLAFTLALLKVLFSKYKLLSYVVRRKKNKTKEEKNEILVIGTDLYWSLHCNRWLLFVGGFVDGLCDLLLRWVQR